MTLWHLHDIVTFPWHCDISMTLWHFHGSNYSIAQFPQTQHVMFCIVHIYIRTCVCMKDWWYIKSTHVCTRCVHYNLHEHMCISGMNTPNLVSMHVGMYKNGPYSLLVHASYFISCSIHAQFASVLSINYKWRWGCRHFWTSRILMFCIEAIELIIR